MYPCWYGDCTGDLMLGNRCLALLTGIIFSQATSRDFFANVSLFGLRIRRSCFATSSLMFRCLGWRRQPTASLSQGWFILYADTTQKQTPHISFELKLSHSRRLWRAVNSLNQMRVDSLNTQKKTRWRWKSFSLISNSRAPINSRGYAFRQS